MVQKKLKGFKELRDYINDLQNTVKFPKNAGQSFKNLPYCEINHEKSRICRVITQRMLGISCIQNSRVFFQEIRKYSEELKTHENEEILTLVKKIEEKLLKRTISEKAHFRVIKEILKKLKTLFLSHRKPIKQEKVQFNKKKWAIFYQPEKMTLKRARLLTKFL